MKREFIYPVISAFVLILTLAGASAASNESKASVRNTPKIGGYVQFRGMYQEDKPSSFRVKRVRLKFTGELTERVKYKVQVDAALERILKDTRLSFIFSPKLSIIVGQFLVPFSYEGNISSSATDLVDRSLIVKKLAPFRDVGFYLTGNIRNLYYGAGFFNGTGGNAIDDNDFKDFISRIVIQPVNGLHTGVSYLYGKRKSDDQTTEFSKSLFGAELQFSYRELSIKSEYIFSKDQVDAYGLYLLLNYKILEHLHLVARYELWEPDTAIADNTQNIITFGTNYFLFDVTKLQLNYLLTHEEGKGIKNQLIGQIQIKF